MGFETQDVERKVISILRILRDSDRPLGSRIIARLLKDCGVELGERAVRYHLKLMDERGLTQLVGQRDTMKKTLLPLMAIACLIAGGGICSYSVQTAARDRTCGVQTAARNRTEIAGDGCGRCTPWSAGCL